MIQPFKKAKPEPSKLKKGNRAFILKSYNEAISLFSEHAEKHPDDYARCHTRIAECYRRSNALLEPVELQPGIKLVSQGDQRNAELHYRMAIQKDPEYGPALYELSTLLPPKSDERFELLKRAAEVSPSYLSLLELGDIYRSVRLDLASAYSTYLSAQERNPKDGDAYRKLQDICRRMGRDDEANKWSLEWKEVNASKKSFNGNTN